MTFAEQRREATINDLAYLLEQILDETVRTRQAIEEQASANEPALYCAPDEHCPGGVRLMKHAPKYWKNDGQDKDRFYHPLPESAYYVFTGDGAFHGQTVRNHNVWRSEALTEGRESADEYVDRETAEIRDDVPARQERRQEAAPAEAPAMQNSGDFLMACNKQLNMHRDDVFRLHGVTRGEQLADVMHPLGSWEELLKVTKQMRDAAKQGVLA